MKKKNPYVMTIGFKKDDPDHVAVAELLNTMGRGKAQYIVKAVLAYQRFQLNGEMSAQEVMSFDYQTIRKMVFQVLDERADKLTGGVLSEKVKKDDSVSEQDALEEFDDNMLNGIMDSLAMFQSV